MDKPDELSDIVRDAINPNQIKPITDPEFPIPKTETSWSIMSISELGRMYGKALDDPKKGSNLLIIAKMEPGNPVPLACFCITKEVAKELRSIINKFIGANY